MSAGEKRLDAANLPKSLARFFHETYEDLAPEFGYETRPETRVAWDELPREYRALVARAVGEQTRGNASVADRRQKLSAQDLKALVVSARRLVYAVEHHDGHSDRPDLAERAAFDSLLATIVSLCRNRSDV